MGKRLEFALDIIESYVDDEPCSYDHHGTCQSHWSEVDDRCSNVVARDFLTRNRPGWDE